MTGDGGKRLEVADAVRELLPERMLRQALRAREREDLRCEICQQAIRHQDDTAASLLALVSAVDTTVVVAHTTCRPSQVIYIEARSQRTKPSTRSSFAGMQRCASARQVRSSCGESLTVFNDSNGDMFMDALRKLGFRQASGTLETVSAPLGRHLGAIHHAITFSLISGGEEFQSFRGFAPGAWTARASHERRVIVLYGANLGLKPFDPERLTARIDAGNVVAATIAFRRDAQ